ncbi:hypothetical protein BZG02_00330 [Labilibaculum filiforme]|uniref:Uncharacterized protein n=1 Tax=Labilibaculum filiforme TaxID=1940526 RepID=A0A2N3I5A5_9BACT|nr:hypothetical protein [Labilibaculum filiforme]PKQ65489.1 hypothetical protein BZG02_00330 [Labilibaculum filiforme]
MGTKSTFIVLILLFSFTGFSQNKINKNKPNEDITVNKEFDKDGNLIRYDSTYIYSWHSDSIHSFTPDSAFYNFSDIHEMRKKMQEQMEHLFSRDSSENKQFHHPFFSDDFFGRDIFDSQFFQNNFFSMDSLHHDMLTEIQKMIEEHNSFSKRNDLLKPRNLDSLHNDFMEKQRRFFQQKDSIYQEKENENSKSIEL